VWIISATSATHLCRPSTCAPHNQLLAMVMTINDQDGEQDDDAPDLGPPRPPALRLAARPTQRAITGRTALPPPSK
jgi:hypothetical protein